MSKVKNAFHDEIERADHLDNLAPWEESECPVCDGHGRIWNNADPTSGQWVPCDECGDTRGHP